MELSGFRRFVMADIPGLIEGASKGAGLGHDFLRHIERTKIIVHILDIMPTDGSDPVANYHAIRNELAQYSETLAEKEEVIVANKIDLDPDGSQIKDLQREAGPGDRPHLRRHRPGHQRTHRSCSGRRSRPLKAAAA